MAYPTTSGRGDAVVQVDFGSGLVNWAGTDNFTLSFNNDISKKRVGDTGDWSLPVITIKDVPYKPAFASAYSIEFIKRLPIKKAVSIKKH